MDIASELISHPISSSRPLTVIHLDITLDHLICSHAASDTHFYHFTLSKNNM
ncbi:hypothetical protein COCC4DRAFT_34816, partial [Bipolaris maydis ATCC 48331]